MGSGPYHLLLIVSYGFGNLLRFSSALKYLLKFYAFIRINGFTPSTAFAGEITSSS